MLALRHAPALTTCSDDRFEVCYARWTQLNCGNQNKSAGDMCPSFVVKQLTLCKMSKFQKSFKVVSAHRKACDDAFDPGFHDAVLVFHGRNCGNLVVHSIFQVFQIGKTPAPHVMFESWKKPKVTGG